MIFAFTGGFFCGIAYLIIYDEIRHSRAAYRRAQAARVSRPVAVSDRGWRDAAGTVALMDQVDAMIERMDEEELDEVIDEMQKRGW